MTAGPTRSVSMPEFRHKAATGTVDLHLFSQTCARFITSRFQDARYTQTQGEPWKQTFPTYIASIIRASNYNLSMSIAALTLVARYQDTLRQRSRCIARTVDEACRLFLTAYIIASRVLYDEQASRKFWRRVSGEQYSCASLTRLEMQFYEMVNWRVCIDPVAYAKIFGEVMQSYRDLSPPQPPPKARTNRPVYQRINSALKSTRSSRKVTASASRGETIIINEVVVSRPSQPCPSIQLTSFNVEAKKYGRVIA